MKHRWVFEASFFGDKIGPYFVKIEDRPQFTISSFKENKVESAWHPITTIINTENEDLENLWKSIGKFYDLGSGMFKDLGPEPEDRLGVVKNMLGEGKLSMIDYSGEELETWIMKGLWPHSINFGDLCYSSDPNIDIAITWRFQRCEYTASIKSPNNLIDHWSFAKSLGFTIKEKYESLFVQLMDSFNACGGPGHIVCGQDISDIFLTVTNYKSTAWPSNWTFTHRARIHDRFDLYTDRTLSNDTILVCGKTGVRKLILEDLLV